ncbi:MAG: hypothetical protein MUO77_12900, partial [Anaerolineales bacterium]|nr:hypothetical protein [Anaerolineales bacterium]
EDTLSSLAGRLVRLAKSLGTAEQAEVKERSGGLSLADLSNRLLDAIDPDKIQESDPQILIDAAVRPLASNPELRARLTEMQSRHEQAIDEVSQDELKEAGFTDEASRLLVRSFEEYIAEHKDEITALEIIYSIPYGRGGSSGMAKASRGNASSQTESTRQSGRPALTFDVLKQLAEVLSQQQHNWTTEALWRAYAQLERDRVRGAGTRRVLADLVSLVRHAVQLDDELVPYPERVQRRYADWLAAGQTEGRAFTSEQRWWLDQVATHIGVNLEIHAEDFNYGEFFNRGGQVAALRTFGPQFTGLLDELNERLNVDRLEG